MTTPDKEEMPTEDRTADLDFDDLETILTIAANGQSGRITPHELRTLVAVYRAYDPMITAMAKIEAWAECRSELHGVFKRIAEEARAALSTLHVNDRHHSGSDNERMCRLLSDALEQMCRYAELDPVEGVVYSGGSHRQVIKRSWLLVRKARDDLNSTDRQTSDDVGGLREALERLTFEVGCLRDGCGGDALMASWQEARAALKGVPAPFSGDLFEAHRLADKLLTMAARRSIETQFGWTHPDCVNLQEAARILKNEPQRPQPEYVGAVLSDAPASEAGKLSTDANGEA
jgi:hypothetical protein